MRVAGIVAQAPEDEIEAIRDYAEHLGLAFQIADDVVDELGHVDSLKKDHGLDRRNDKLTFLSLLGMERSREKVADEVAQAKAAVQCLGTRAAILEAIAEFIAGRVSPSGRPEEGE